MALLGPRSIIVGGWFGADGVSAPDINLITDGWFLPLPPVEIKAIYINSDGNYEEIGVPLLGLHEDGYYKEVDP